MARLKYGRYGFTVATGVAVAFRGAEHIYDSLKDELGLLDKTQLNSVDYVFMNDKKQGRSGNDPFSTLHLTLEEATAGSDGIIQSKKVQLRCNPTKSQEAAKALKNKTVTLQDNDSTGVINWKIVAVAIC